MKTERLTENSTDLCHRFEDHTGETDCQLYGFHIGKLQQQVFVLWCEEQVGIRL